MALLRIEIGAESAQVNASNAKAAAIAEEYLATIGAQPDNTPAEKLDMLLASLVEHMRETADREKVRAAGRAAKGTVQRWEP